MKRAIAIAMLLVATTLAAVGVAAPPADASHCPLSSYDVNSSWGCARLTRSSPDYIQGAVVDKVTDGYCVSVFVKAFGASTWLRVALNCTTGSILYFNEYVPLSSYDKIRMVRGSYYSGSGAWYRTLCGPPIGACH